MRDQDDGFSIGLCVCIVMLSSPVHDAKEIGDEQMLSTTLIGIRSVPLSYGATKNGAKYHTTITSCSCVSKCSRESIHHLHVMMRIIIPMQIGQAHVMYMACTTTFCMKLDGDLALDVADHFVYRHFLTSMMEARTQKVEWIRMPTNISLLVPYCREGIIEISVRHSTYLLSVAGCTSTCNLPDQ